MTPFGLSNSRHASVPVASDHSNNSNSNNNNHHQQNQQQQHHDFQCTVAPAARPVPFARARESANWRATAGSVLQNNMTTPPPSLPSISPTSPVSLTSRFTSERLPPYEKLMPASNPLWAFRGSHMSTPSADRFSNNNNMAAASGYQGQGNATPPATSNAVDRFGRLDLGEVQQPQHEFYAYCFDRGNGRYTRLIPADMLPALRDVPAFEMSPENMMIVPVPRGVGPEGRSSNLEPVVWQAAPTSAGGMNDNVQRAAAANPDPWHHSQSQIDSIVASSPQQPKRVKVYCDKWVHEGTCAFTQQGCRFKHEMPHDRVTQQALGLFHGLPAWWKKQQAELARQQRDLGDVSNQPVALVSNNNNNTNNTVPANEQQQQRNHRERSASGHALPAPSRPCFHQSDDDTTTSSHGTGSATVVPSSPPPSSGRAAAGSVSSWQRPSQCQSAGIVNYSSPFGPIGTPRTRYAPEPPPPTPTTTNMPLRRAPQAVNNIGIADMNPYASLHQLEYRGESPDTDKDEGVKLT
ncbi:hypothetical protein B0T19DRAFT_400184 [Cercophora scortea]|uniref:C3H1-type domain-containing protein n=1 Tax=Cercophora scortea TaxID=314031 RepID=A0AAE0ILN0_9PEZI|nr:hypothetical protein B0T19DRAFT_400184 [Cercophora scortea]